MTSTLTKRDYQLVVRCLQELYCHPDLATLPRAAVKILRPLVRATAVGFTEVDPVLERISHCIDPPQPREAELLRLFDQHVADHPVIRHAQRTRDGGANAISDFLSAREFHKTQLYQKVFGPWSVEDQLSIGMVGSAGLIIGLSFNRDSRGFSRRDREILNMVRPHLLNVYLICRERWMVKNIDDCRPGAIIEQLPIGMICVDKGQRMVWCTRTASRILFDHFPDMIDSIHGLPNDLRVWLRGAMRATDGGAMEFRQLASRCPGRTLHLSRCPLSNGQALLLLEDRSLPAAKVSFDRYGLTRRESDVMVRMLGGDSVTQAADRLSMSQRTLEKHLEHIFRKLGVNSVRAACVRILGAKITGDR